MTFKKILCVAAGLAGVTQIASAQATSLDLDFEQINQQTSSSTTALSFYAAEEQAVLAAPGNPANVTVARPNGTNDRLAPFFTQLDCFSSTYSNLASFNHDWGLGNYTYSGNSGALNAVLSNGLSMWAQAPQVTNYLALQGLSPVTGGVVSLSSFVQDPNATSSMVAIYVYDLTHLAVVAQQTFSSSITSFDLTPGMLQQNNQYSINVEYLNVLSMPSAIGFQGATPTITYNEVTNATFFTAVPEPTPIAMLAMGLFGLVASRPRRSKTL